jgi:diacylglycerol kinase family enzyme
MQSFLVDGVRIEPKKKMLAWNIAVDGEIVRVTPPLEYRHVPGALRVVVGETASNGL